MPGSGELMAAKPFNHVLDLPKLKLASLLAKFSSCTGNKMIESLIMRLCHHCQSNQGYHLHLNLPLCGTHSSIIFSFALAEERSFGMILKSALICIHV